MWSEACVQKLATLRTEVELIVASDAMMRTAVALKQIWNLPFCLFHTTYDCFRDTKQLPVETRSYVTNRWSLVQNASLNLHATDPYFEGKIDTLSSRHRWIGPLFWEPTDFAPSCLQDPGDPWVLLSSSLAPVAHDEDVAQVVSEAIKTVAARMIITGAAGIKSSRRIVRTKRFASHRRILSRVRACICHAGHGTVMKSMAHGVPMVLIPSARDQFGVAKRAEDCGVAIVIPPSNLSVATAHRAIKRVLSSSTYRRGARAWAKRLRRMDALVAAAAHLRQLVNAP